MQIINKEKFTGFRFNDGDDVLEIDCFHYLNEVTFSTIFGDTGTVSMNKEELAGLIESLKVIHSRMP